MDSPWMVYGQSMGIHILLGIHWGTTGFHQYKNPAYKKVSLGGQHPGRVPSVPQNADKHLRTVCQLGSAPLTRTPSPRTHLHRGLTLTEDSPSPRAHPHRGLALTEDAPSPRGLTSWGEGSPPLKSRFRETMPMLFSIVGFPPSGSYFSPFGRTHMF